jgi:hypothetical protein
VLHVLLGILSVLPLILNILLACSSTVYDPITLEQFYFCVLQPIYFCSVVYDLGCVMFQHIIRITKKNGNFLSVNVHHIFVFYIASKYLYLSLCMLLSG